MSTQWRKARRQTYKYSQGCSGPCVSLWLTPSKQPVFGKARHISEPEQGPQAEEWRLNVIDWEERSLTSPSTHCPLLSGVIYIKETWGKGSNNTCTQPVNPTVMEILQTRTPSMPKTQIPPPHHHHHCSCCFENQNIPHPFATHSRVFSFSSSPPQKTGHSCWCLYSYTISMHKRKKNAPCFQ